MQPTDDPQDLFESAKTKLVAALKEALPTESASKRLVVDDVWVDDNVDIWDLDGQKKAKAAEKTWGIPVYGSFRVLDVDGKELSSAKRMKILTLPKITPRRSFIVAGTEQQIVNQMRLEPGVYTRVKKNKEIESHINLSRGGKGVAPRLIFNPEKTQFLLKARSSNVPLYPILKLLDVDDNEIKAKLGRDLYDRMKTDDVNTGLRKLYRAIYQEEPEPDSMWQELKDYFAATEISADNTTLTLGRGHDRMNGELLLDTAAKIARVLRGEEKPDDRDALHFKSIHSYDDFMAERIQKNAGLIRSQIRRGLADTPSNMAKVVRADRIDRMFNAFMSGQASQLSQNPSQINPLEMLSNAGKATILYEGGVTDRNQVTVEQRNINPTHIGFLDPIHTPESSDTGTTLHIATGASKSGDRLMTEVIAMDTGRRRQLSMKDMWNSHVAFPGEFTFEKGKPHTSKPMVKVYYRGEISEVAPKEADYAIASASNLFDSAVNLLPFLGSLEGARAMMASKHQEQAVSLVNREAPLVQTAAKGGRTFEEVVGAEAQTIKAPIDGIVEAVNDKTITIRPKRGDKREAQLYRHFFTNSKNALNSEPIVQVGDAVTAGQVIADSGFTRGGRLALGLNARVGYVPYKGHNFEDGIVISESMSRRLSSEHLYRMTSQKDDRAVHDKQTFATYFPGAHRAEQLDALDADGVAKVGTKLRRGDPVILRIIERQDTDTDGRIAALGKGRVRPFVNQSTLWTEDFEGEVVDVIKVGAQINVLVRTIEAAQLGDKLSNRHAAKGVITKIVPDSEMPKDKTGPLEILLNPAGVPNRINPSQLLEAAAGKAARKTATTATINNFGHDDHLSVVRGMLRDAGLTDYEDLEDPKTGAKIPDVFVGDAYFMKLDHPVRKKFSARSTGRYTADMIPAKVSGESAQSMDFLTTMSMVAHGAKHNLREASSIKGQKSDEFFRALELGEALPPPEVPEAVRAFEAKMRALGVNIERQGTKLRLVPVTDQETLAMSNGEITRAYRLRGTDLKPDPRGLFDPVATGGLKGDRWAHVRLAEPMPNPVFENAILWTTGLKQKEFDDVVAGRLFVDPETGETTKKDTGVTGGYGIRAALRHIDVDKEIASATKQAVTAREDALDQINRKLRILTNLKVKGIRPEQLVMENMPVLPPKFRPIYNQPDGTLVSAGLNDLYRDVILANNAMKGESFGRIPQRFREPSREALYNSLRAAMGFGDSMSRPGLKGIFQEIKGARNKGGYFQSKLLKKPQDLTGRSTVIADPDLGVDQVAIPEEMAWQIFKPFIIAELRRQFGIGPLKAEDEWRDRTESARIALEHAMEGKPVLMNRAPSLHKHSIMALKPTLSADRSIHVNTAVTKGMNMDFDGDTASIHVPITDAATEEAKRMFPSRNFLSTSGEFLLEPRHEFQAGLWLATRPGGKKIDRVFKDDIAALEAYERGELAPDDQVKIDGEWHTIGQLAVRLIVPPAMRATMPKTLTAANTKALLTQVAEGNPKALPEVLDALKDIGGDAAYRMGLSVGLSDLEDAAKIRPQRDRIMNDAKKHLERANVTAENEDERRSNFERIYGAADKRMTELAVDQIPDDNGFKWMLQSGARGTPSNLKQLLAAPVIVEDISRRPFQNPVTRSYAEGLDPASYWSTLYGSRMGIIDRALSTVEPGALNKSLLHTTVNYTVTSRDCGTKRGKRYRVDSPDLVGRYLAEPVAGVGRDDPITPRIRSKLEKAGIQEVRVRTPLYCETPQGVCARCWGTDELGNEVQKGTNAGVISGQSITEPMTQMVLSAFHSGGQVKNTDQMASTQLEAIRGLLELPTGPRNKAIVAQKAGRIEKVEKTSVGGFDVTIAGKVHAVPPRKDLIDTIREGAMIEAGDALSVGIKDPRDVMKLKGPYAAREHIADTLHQIYSGGGKRIPRKHFETVAAAVANTTRVRVAPEDSPYIAGDIAPLDEINRFNVTGASKKVPLREGRGKALLDDIEAVGGLGKILTDADLDRLSRLGMTTVNVNPDSVFHEPVLKGINMAPLTRKDFLSGMAFRNLKKVVTQGAAEGWTSDLRGGSPLPAFIYGELEAPEDYPLVV